MPTCVIFNPAARGEKAKHFRDQLAALSAQLTLKPTYAAGDGRTLAAQAVREGFDTVVAAGGDGTVNEVLNGLGDAPDGFTKARIGILPLGTINVFAKELGLPTRFAPAAKAIEQGRESLIDLPQAQFVVGGQPCARYFAQLAGAGLDSRAIELVDSRHKKAIGPLAYVLAGFKALAEPKANILARAEPMDDRGWKIDERAEKRPPSSILHLPSSFAETGQLVLVGNGRYYGGTFKLFPKADLRDGLLDVTVFPKVNWAVLLRSGWGWLTDRCREPIGARVAQPMENRGWKIEDRAENRPPSSILHPLSSRPYPPSSNLISKAGCKTFQAESLTLTSDGKVALELDGDNVGHLPVRFSIRRQVLRVIVP
jgi:diacylglycerol kinase family enzyme